MTTVSNAFGDGPQPDEIAAATERMIASAVFSRSPQLGAFLRFIVNAVLDGKADRIKAYTIGIEVLRRDSKFDPQLDPIVRVEATRLRRAIERYYAGAGSADPLVIDLPRGSYVPTFRRRDPVVIHAEPVLDKVRRWSLPWQHPSAFGVSVAAIALAALMLVGIFVFERRHGVGVLASLHAEAAAERSAGNGMPTIKIDPFRVIGTPSANGIVPERLYAKVSDAFTRFDTINVASGSEAHADYRLTGTLEYAADGSASAWFTLNSSAEGKIVWSRTFEPRQDDGTTTSGNSIVIGLTNSLLQSYGVIRSRDRARQLATNAGDPRYRCILEAADAMRTADRDAHFRARDCLERLTTADPSFAVGLIFLAMMYNREFQLEYQRPDDPPVLDLALRTVRQAIALNPEDSRAYLSLMIIQFNRRDLAAGIAAGEKCIALNRYDMLALGEYGGRMIFAGDIETGMKRLVQAGAHGAVRPTWHHIYLFVGSYMLGDTAAAVRHAHNISNDNTPLGQIARALAAKAEGNQKELRHVLDRLAAVGPRWYRDPRPELSRVIADPAIVDRLARDLAEAGVPGGV